MRTQVKTLYDSAKSKYMLTLRGGENGLNNDTSWVYVAEDIQTVSFLKGGELVITTGLFTQSGVKLYNFIRTIALHNCSGILINVGKYVSLPDLTPEIIEFCNVNKFPIFTMPWEVHLVDILQDFCRLFLDENHWENQLSATFQNAINQLPVPDNTLRTLNQFGFATAGNYRIFVIRNLIDKTRITSPLNRYGWKYHLFEYENMQVLVHNTAQTQLSLEGMIELLCYCDSIRLGISDAAPSLAQISLYYKRARFSLAVAEFRQKPYVRFDELGLFQILFNTSDPGLLETFYLRHLGALANYDLDHDSDYLNTLKIYLMSDCSLLDTASRMHTHRNTVIYRIRKIKEILKTELDNAAEKFNLLLAFYIKEYLSIQ
ncbi:PucR family transcriptional regulator ligand-binding domain-containing protein [Desulfosporosinus sp. PR]|uniref:PucR family transcriptional regulator n=1 Tax=Candidatus Desulfosporosinus nitrosoreducens TaxID=3401928 RepID=UPI0027F9825E|nr:PucR family transcriptional regulator ligand-binding domain-containing protein [Desulfosporosinus sp. PR]MDQ7096561.1 PucR family transcriptional regulator ligand-binding domain-containing protein [Desulfosporosinus sp. PR]